jgi:hypothetical protein
MWDENAVHMTHFDTRTIELSACRHLRPLRPPEGRLRSPQPTIVPEKLQTLRMAREQSDTFVIYRLIGSALRCPLALPPAQKRNYAGDD